jgi:hypothetical protein
MIHRPLALALAGLSLAASLAPVQATERRIDRAEIAGEKRRACPQFGTGFAAIPGTGACTRVSGRVSAEAGNLRRGPDREGPVSASGRLAIDTRTETEYGPARAFVRFGVGRR